MPKKKEDSVYKTFSKVESLLYKKAEEIVESLNDKEREVLEGKGWVLDLEDVFRAVVTYLSNHFNTKEFSLEHIEQDLKKIDKKILFELR